MDNTASTSTATDSGIQSAIKRRRIEKINATDEITDALFNEVAKFHAAVYRIKIKSEPERTDEDYKRLYRLYKAVIKSLEWLKNEGLDLEDELKPLSSHSEALLRSSDDNVKLWSQYFHKDAISTKSKGVKTLPSPTTERISGLLSSVKSFILLTAMAVCLNKCRQEDIDDLERLLVTCKKVIPLVEKERDKIEKMLGPFMERNRDNQNSNPGTSA